MISAKKKRQGAAELHTWVPGVEWSSVGGGEHVRFAERGPKHEGLTSTNAFPDVDAFSFGVPHAALGVEGPVEVELPDASGVRDETGHAVQGAVGQELRGRRRRRGRWGREGATGSGARGAGLL